MGKLIGEFGVAMINREGYFVGETERECTKCGVMFPKTSKTVTMCNECNSSRVKGESVEVKMLRRAKSRAKSRNLDFDIDLSDVVIPTHCPVLGTELKMYSGQSGGRMNSPSLDRIHNDRGYVKGNVMVVSHQANMMKSSASIEQLVMFAKWIIKTHGNSATDVANSGEHK
jgi:hypothetical protein